LTIETGGITEVGLSHCGHQTIAADRGSSPAEAATHLDLVMKSKASRGQTPVTVQAGFRSTNGFTRLFSLTTN